MKRQLIKPKKQMTISPESTLEIFISCVYPIYMETCLDEEITLYEQRNAVAYLIMDDPKPIVNFIMRGESLKKIDFIKDADGCVTAKWSKQDLTIHFDVQDKGLKGYFK